MAKIQRSGEKKAGFREIMQYIGVLSHTRRIFVDVMHLVDCVRRVLGCPICVLRVNIVHTSVFSVKKMWQTS